MTAIFHDVREDPALDEELFEHRPPNHDFDEVLYADDTIIFSTCTETLQKYLHKIEETAGKYGLHLNKQKCETRNTNPQIACTIHYRNGDKVKAKEETKYLGCKLNRKADIEKEINLRLSQCNAIWKRLDTFWKHSNTPRRLKNTRIRRSHQIQSPIWTRHCKLNKQYVNKN